jgi:hypothetical protein
MQSIVVETLIRQAVDKISVEITFLSKKCATEIKSTEKKTCQNLENPQNLETTEKDTYTVCVE